MIITLPDKVKKIIGILTEAGFEAYAVGGCIRDTLLGRTPEDWDITTSAQPGQVKSLFRRTIDTGIKHGTVTVMLDKEGFEVTTYRIDGEYEDGRHPKEVIFTRSLREDLKRRDFTMNALAYNDQKGLVDLFGGLGDMQKGCIRCVGDALERFTEDALRIMRAIRFSAQLGYEIEESTREAIVQLAPRLAQISAERIRAELVKLLVSDHPDYLRMAYEAGVTAVILPELDIAMETPQNHPHHCYSVGEHLLHSMKEIAPVKELRLAMLLHDIGKPAVKTQDEEGIDHFHGHPEVSARMAEDILRRLRFDNDTISVVSRLILYHDYGSGVMPDRRMVRRAMNKMGEDLLPMIIQVKQADILSQSGHCREEKLKQLERWNVLYQEIMEKRECVSIKSLAVTGRDLIALGMKPGPQLGDTLKSLLAIVLDHPELNEKEYLLSQVTIKP